MRMLTPATRWQDASPTGSGAVGAMHFGRICRDRILLNHEALYAPRPRPELLDVSDQLPELRRRIRTGRYRAAQELMPAVHAQRGGTGEGSTSDATDPYQPLCDLLIQATTRGPFRHYRRGVDVATGRVWCTWEDDDGPQTRELFVSRVTDTVFLRLSADRAGAVSCRLSMNRDSFRADEGGEWAASRGLAPPASSAAAQGSRLHFTASFAHGASFGAVAEVTASGGRVEAQDSELVVTGADAVLLRARLFVGADPAAAVADLTAELAAETTSFATALAAHEAEHRRLFGSTRLSLGGRSAESRQAGNETLLLEAYDERPSTELIQRMYELGRYLLICSSRPGGWPANLQGIWNGDAAPAWNSDFHLDENVQMNYWQALPGNLAETVLPLFDYLERFLDDYRANARRLYGCRGLFLPIAQTTHGIALPMVWTNWISAAGWLAQHYYDYYLFSGDEDFLRTRAVPWLRQVAQFYEDFLVEGTDGRLQFIPSMSPENVPAGDGKGLITINATMDVAVCREVLGNLIAACQRLQLDEPGLPTWRDMLARLPAYEVNEDGALREWLHPDFPDNYHHRHQSHIYPLFPGTEVTQETEPELFEACRIAVEKRLVVGLASQSGWSMAHMANIYARLGDGDRALQCLEILARSSTGPNLFTYHNDWRDMGLSLSGWGRTPPFQIDANLGLSAAVLEMLVFSRPGWVKLLPALPAAWPQGRIEGVRCRGGITVDLVWDQPAGTLEATLTADQAQRVHVVLPSCVAAADTGHADDTRQRVDAGLEAGVAYRIAGRWTP